MSYAEQISAVAMAFAVAGFVTGLLVVWLGRSRV